MKRSIFFKAYVLSAILVSLLLYSCEEENPLDCMKNTGEIVTESRQIDSVKTVILYDNVNLVLTQSESQHIEIEAGKNLQKKIKTTLQNDTLIIRNNNSCNWVRSYDKEITAYLNIDSLSNIEYRGSGDISCTNTIRGDSIRLDVWGGAGKIELDLSIKTSQTYLHTGTADIHISGNCNTSLISSESYGLIDARQLTSSFTYISSSSSNHCYVYALHTLDATLSSIGNIYYVGEPINLTTNIDGSGAVLPLE